MLRLITRMLPLVLFIGLLAACGGTPTIAVTPEKIDFGAIPASDPVTTTIQVRNEGSGALQISGVSTSCGCTTATLSTPDVAAGATADLQVSFNPQAHPGLYGPLLRIVYLESNDPAQPEVEVPVTVEILKPKEE